MVEVRTRLLKQYEMGRGNHLFSLAWDECIELQVSNKQAWFQSVTMQMSSFDRWEITAWCGDLLVGGVIIAEDSDIHVGTCMSVLFQYVAPAFRNRGCSIRLMRETIRIAQEHSLPILAYTHRLGDWRYETIYKRINNGAQEANRSG